MNPLPKGITGFDTTGEIIPLKQFTSACHATVRQTTGQVQQIRAAYDQRTTNFHEALITLPDHPDPIRVLCNAHHPTIAFATPAQYEGATLLDFTDCPQLAAAFPPQFTILTQQEACAHITNELLSELGQAELNQLRYWQAQRIGNVIFNHWD